MTRHQTVIERPHARIHPARPQTDDLWIVLPSGVILYPDGTREYPEPEHTAVTRQAVYYWTDCTTVQVSTVRTK